MIICTRIAHWLRVVDYETGGTGSNLAAANIFSLVHTYHAYIATLINQKGTPRIDPYLTNNPLTAKLFNWNFHPLEVVSR